MKAREKWALVALILAIWLLVLVGLLYDEGRDTEEGDLHAQIEQAQDKRALLALAWENEAEVKIGLITPMQYAENCVLLAQKLGFAITTDRLSQETAAILEETRE